MPQSTNKNLPVVGDWGHFLRLRLGTLDDWKGRTGGLKCGSTKHGGGSIDKYVKCKYIYIYVFFNHSQHKCG